METTAPLEVPTVDLADLRSPRLEDQHRAQAALTRGFGHFGLVYVKNASLASEDLESFYRSYLEFTARPLAEKEALSGDDIWYQRGWTPPNTEQAVVAGGQPDFKECYFAAPEPLDELAKQMYPQIYAPNRWPSGFDGAEEFREKYMMIGHELHEVGLALLRGCATALGLKPFVFEAMAHGGPHVTRALRYLPVSDAQISEGVVWGEEHTDFNLLTVLPGGRFLNPETLVGSEGIPSFCPPPEHSTAGLYLRTRPTEAFPRGEMVRGKPPPGCMVAQVGQMLEILTGGRYMATPHVIKATSGFERCSMAHFCHVHATQMLFPLKEFADAEAIEAYSPPVLAGTYGLKTLYDIGLTPKTALGQLGYRNYDILSAARAAEEKVLES